MILPYFLWFDPVYWITMVIGYVVLMIVASTVAPKLARGLSGRFSLYISMALLALVLTSITALSIWAALYLGGLVTLYEIPLIVIFIVAMNFLTYIISPFIINLFYNAEKDNELQQVVDAVAKRLGLGGRIKAVLVNGPPNAFSYGNFIAGRYVAVSRSLYRMLNRDELEAVVGHELGHHIHRDNLVMTFFGLFPAVVYYLGYSLVWQGILGGRDERGSSGGGLFMLVGIALVVISFIEQLLVLAFSRMREYYADYVGARAAGRWPMQKALAKLHLYYENRDEAAEDLRGSKLKTLFIYAFVQAFGSPLYEVTPDTVERIKRLEVGGIGEVLSDHPPVPKRLRFLDSIEI
ncbi:zinc metalloprotease HtpX [Thermoproteus tenax]|uniref:Protease HtpX homolog n=1 Tax=Thermoproteus tenax (strain ATCC 35583 / DSM 2078 / JCM 9277 / NBRC 100435 / Kra 1) TaxID=768679 RepID=G4RKS2_THETK|nr:zinc metalloprotease HtpX [Thermoproteus tenax]CCC82167.1 predicted protease, htpX (heat shock protein) homolog [Thermoproteus tenax Kra 1]